MYNQEALEAQKTLQLTELQEKSLLPISDTAASTEVVTPVVMAAAVECIQKASALPVLPASQQRFIDADKKAAADILYSIRLQLQRASWKEV